MKKLVITLCIILAGSTFAGAQKKYVGGSFNFSVTNGNASNSISIAPRLGFQINDRFSVGGLVSLGYTSNLSIAGTTAGRFSLGAFPFIRYAFWRFGRFSMGFEARTGTRLDFYGSESLSDSNRGAFGLVALLDVAPLLTYDLSERISLETTLNFASLNYTHQSIWIRDNDTVNVTASNSFSGGFNTANIMNTGAMTIGFIYRF